MRVPIEIRAPAILMRLFCLQIEGFANGINIMLMIKSSTQFQKRKNKVRHPERLGRKQFLQIHKHPPRPCLITDQTVHYIRLFICPITSPFSRRSTKVPDFHAQFVSRHKLPSTTKWWLNEIIERLCQHNHEESNQIDNYECHWTNKELAWCITRKSNNLPFKSGSLMLRNPNNETFNSIMKVFPSAPCKQIKHFSCNQSRFSRSRSRLDVVVSKLHFLI